MSNRSYFRYFPNIDYVSRALERSSNDEFITVKNIFKRARLREDVASVATSYEYYTVPGDFRPDQVADRYYDDPNLDWVILITNNIQNIHQDWPMDDRTFRNYLLDKYGSEEAIEQIHHYETSSFQDGYVRTVIPDGLVVDSDFNTSILDQRLKQEVKYNANIDLTTEGTVDVNGTVTNANGEVIRGKGITPITNYKYEFDINEMKKNIIILKPEYLGIFIDDMKKIMSYTQSSQYINKNLKQSYNPRLTGI
tara:strand:- start:22 stop:777 length:756 start_codon:yes stop_codon:yes gene_type:complete